MRYAPAKSGRRGGQPAIKMTTYTPPQDTTSVAQPYTQSRYFIQTPSTSSGGSTGMTGMSSYQQLVQRARGKSMSQYTRERNEKKRQDYVKRVGYDPGSSPGIYDDTVNWERADPEYGKAVAEWMDQVGWMPDPVTHKFPWEN